MLRCPSVRSSRFPPGRLAGTPCVINLGLFVSFLLMGWIDHMSKRGLLGDTTGRGETAAELGETRSPGLATDAGPEFLASLSHRRIVVGKEPFYEASDESALRCTSRPDLGSHPEPDTAQEAKEESNPFQDCEIENRVFGLPNPQGREHDHDGKEHAEPPRTSYLKPKRAIRTRGSHAETSILMTAYFFCYRLWKAR